LYEPDILAVKLFFFQPMEGHKSKVGKIHFAVAVYVACDESQNYDVSFSLN
jgi:hypothetical protein